MFAVATGLRHNSDPVNLNLLYSFCDSTMLSGIKPFSCTSKIWPQIDVEVVDSKSRPLKYSMTQCHLNYCTVGRTQLAYTISMSNVVLCGCKILLWNCKNTMIRQSTHKELGYFCITVLSFRFTFSVWIFFDVHCGWMVQNTGVTKL